MPLEEPNLSTLTRKIVPSNRIIDKLPKLGDAKPKIISIDIMGIIIRADNPKDENSQRFMFVDMEKMFRNAKASHCPRETYLHSLSIRLSRLLLGLNLGLILFER
ncbi:hypothetical protein LIER_24961 [Lithospermum erythrorhizon]|uniref:Uncharacterized protein n=1 Tax=Lithospermum erythrorhizon TaxID=34254 RepID=A0AAV3R676_LITER